MPRLHRVLIHSTVEITAATNQSVTATVMIQAFDTGHRAVCKARKIQSRVGNRCDGIGTSDMLKPWWLLTTKDSQDLGGRAPLYIDYLYGSVRECGPISAAI
jgi:hypothetical protein